MSSVASIAVSGMHAAVRRLEASAVRIAQGSNVSAADEPDTSASSQVDYAEEAVEQTLASYDFTANALVLRTHARMMSALFDTTV